MDIKDFEYVKYLNERIENLENYACIIQDWTHELVNVLNENLREIDKKLEEKSGRPETCEGGFALSSKENINGNYDFLSEEQTKNFTKLVREVCKQEIEKLEHNIVINTAEIKVNDAKDFMKQLNEQLKNLVSTRA